MSPQTSADVGIGAVDGLDLPCTMHVKRTEENDAGTDDITDLFFDRAWGQQEWTTHFEVGHRNSFLDTCYNRSIN